MSTVGMATDVEGVFLAEVCEWLRVESSVVSRVSEGRREVRASKESVVFGRVWAMNSLSAWEGSISVTLSLTPAVRKDHYDDHSYTHVEEAKGIVYR